ncbi:MAG: FKBP-type peptidyl-prolyl cis-trans isomerase [Gammaproteobacteria bacterium]|nr:FKBP-type peptidyl-prolyl cis-trans isomerase [Gammaproteobacteria bacterium]
MNRFIVFWLILGLFCSGVASAAATAPSTDKEKLSYALGVLFAQNVKLEADVDNETFLQGIRDVLENAGLKLTNEEMQRVMQQYRERQVKMQGEQAKQNAEVGRKFLTENQKKDGVVQTASGLQYKVLKTGDGKKPALDSTVLVHYRGTLINGKEFDSSYSRGQPTEIPLHRVIKGWQEAVTMMQAGSKWEIYVPSALGYGEKQAGPDIGPNSTLVFEIELLEIK